jgi:uncharacterized BrkB/YihY/UPF0761 family membrane protein
MSVIAKTLDFAKDSGRFLYYYIVKPQELRSSLKKRKISEILLSVAALAAFIVALPFVTTVGYVASSGGTTKFTDQFLVKLTWEFSIIVLVVVMACVFTVAHWLLALLLREKHSIRDLFLVSIHVVGAWIILLLAGWYLLAMAQNLGFVLDEWEFRSISAVLFSLYFYSMIVQIINFPPFRAGAWAMLLLSAPSMLIAAEALLDL